MQYGGAVSHDAGDAVGSPPKFIKSKGKKPSKDCDDVCHTNFKALTNRWANTHPFLCGGKRHGLMANENGIENIAAWQCPMAAAEQV